jgi:hypothetical protein
MGLTNRMSYAFVDRPSNAPDMGEESLRAVATQSALAKNAQLPIRLLEKFAIMQVTGLWPLVFSPERCLATAAFSNLGDPSRRFRTRFPRENGLIRVGNLIMHQFEGTTALRPHTSRTVRQHVRKSTQYQRPARSDDLQHLRCGDFPGSFRRQNRRSPHVGSRRVADIRFDKSALRQIKLLAVCGRLSRLGIRHGDLRLHRLQLAQNSVACRTG